MDGSRRLGGNAAALGFVAALVAAAGVFLLRAWVADDAYLTYRVVDNALHGHGLRWNVDERVQIFTHPLWALAHLPTTAALGSPERASLLLSALCLAGLGAALWRGLGLDRRRFLLVAVLPLVASTAFGDYVISGLETPLAALLLAGFALLAVARPERPAWLAISAAAALAATNRLDALLLLLPAGAALLVTSGFRVAWGRVALGSLPLVGWLAFSVVYYGFALPNTRYAKLDTGIPGAALAHQGLAYLLDFARHDPAGALWIALALAVGAFDLTRARRGRDARAGARRLLRVGLAVGVAVHLLYVVRIGGDFMRGRLFAPALAVSVVVVADAARSLPLVAAAAAGALLLLLRLGVEVAGSELSPDNAGYRGIVDERAIFAPWTAFATPGPVGEPRDHAWARTGLAVRREAEAGGAPRVVRRGNVGLFGYFAGPEVIIVDTFGLGDPLLARLPVSNPEKWRIGHFHRAPPEGYLIARRTGLALHMDPDLRDYYERLRRVVSGPLFTRERWREIARFALGANDRLLDRYLERRGRRG